MSLAYLLGVTLGDGCLYYGKNVYQFSVVSEDLDLCEKCQSICLSLFNKSGTIKPIYKNNHLSYYKLVVCSKKIVDYLHDLTKGKTILPEIDDLDLIRGLMDTDGWISEVHAKDGYIRYRVGFKNIAHWTPYFHALLQKNGVKVGKLSYRAVYRYKKRNQDVYVFSINTKDYCNKVGFGIHRKQEIARKALGK